MVGAEFLVIQHILIGDRGNFLKLQIQKLQLLWLYCMPSSFKTSSLALFIQCSDYQTLKNNVNGNLQRRVQGNNKKLYRFLKFLKFNERPKKFAQPKSFEKVSITQCLFLFLHRCVLKPPANSQTLGKLQMYDCLTLFFPPRFA